MIYFIETNGLVKIGYSNDPMRRLTGIATWCPTKCHLIGVIDGDMKAERELHKRFGAFHSHGEWFRFERPINDYIRENAITIDKSSHSRKPPKNAPENWNEISAAARECGAGDWAMRKWLERKAIPASWKIKLMQHTRGRLKVSDMEITQHKEAAE